MPDLRAILTSWPLAWSIAVGVHALAAMVRLSPRDDRPELETVEFTLAELPERPVSEPPPPAPPDAEPSPGPPGPKSTDPEADPTRTSLQSNRPAEGPPDEPVPIVTGLPLDASQLSEGGMGVRVGNTAAPGYDADVPPGDLTGFAGGGAGGGEGDQSVAPIVTPDGEPRLLRAFEPPYPDSMRQQHIEGRVVLEVEVLANGRAGRVRVARGVHPDLDDAALLAVQRFRWQPARRDGKKIVATTFVAIRFELVE